MNYYNEIDPKAAAWIEELINEGLIPNGKIDTRSIVDVQPGDLRGFTQAHFFCGIAGWSRALRLAGWPDDREIWTGSCPCQPFSAAGKGEGLNDERHLWPHLYRLICACRPRVVVGEQVASSLVVGKAGGKADSESPVWIDGVRLNMEAAHYAFGATDLPAACINAPHIRQRLWWVANSIGVGLGQRPASKPGSESRLANAECDGRRTDEPGRGQEGRAIDGRDCEAVRLGNAESERCGEAGPSNGRPAKRSSDSSELCGMGEPIPTGLQGHTGDGDNRSQSGRLGAVEAGSVAETGESGFWDNATWHLCRDGKSRRIPAGSQHIFQRMVDELLEGMDPVRIASHGFPLAPKVQGRAAILKGYGNAIVPELAAEFIKAVMQEIE